MHAPTYTLPDAEKTNLLDWYERSGFMNEAGVGGDKRRDAFLHQL